MGVTGNLLIRTTGDGVCRASRRSPLAGTLLLILACSLLSHLAGPARADGPPTDASPRFALETPSVVLTDVPVAWIRITALQPDGSRDTDFNEQVRIEGVRLTVTETLPDGTLQQGKSVSLPSFENGLLELTSDLVAGRKLYITGETLIVAPESPLTTELHVTRTFRWLSLVPPLVAILLAIIVRNVLLALFAGVWSGAVILTQGNLFAGLIATLDTHLLDEIVGNRSHVMIILFTMFLGAMIGVMSRSGGTQAVVEKLARFTRTREHGQVLTWLLGFLVFFDDYANTLLVGGTMRPMTDRLRISREKLAFLVDSTAAPVAGLAVVSTWVGVEVGYIQDTLARLFADSPTEWNSYSVFLATLPYRFYPALLLVFVWLIAWTGRDFGPMRKAEQRAFVENQVARPGAEITAARFDEAELPAGTGHMRDAWIPLLALLLLIVLGMWWTGASNIAAANADAATAGDPPEPYSFYTILANAESERVLFLSSFAAAAIAVLSAVVSRSLSIGEAIAAWAAGARSMMFAIIILILAWSIATLCDGDHLNTAGFLVELSRGQVSVEWMPMLAFVLASAVSFATGSSFATMGLLMPLLISVSYYLLADLSQADPYHPLMLATIGAVLAGSIFGDHCSPISDTTVLSSAAASCDHLDHVGTQFPYAATVGGVCLLLAYLPLALGFQLVWVLLPLCVAALVVIVRVIGRRPQAGN